MSLSANRRPPSDQVRGQAPPEHALIPERRPRLLEHAANAYRTNPYGEPARVVGLDREAAQRRRPHRGLELGRRDLAQEASDRLLLGHADHRVVVARHADVGDKGGAARQDALVGGRGMRVGADHEADAAVEEMSHRLLLARRLGMHVDHDRVDAALERTGGELAVERREGIIEGVHEYAAHGVDDERIAAVLALDQGGAAAGPASRIVAPGDQPRRPLDEDQRLLLVPGMVAERDRVGPGVEEILVDRLGDAEAARRVLAVDDDEIELPVAHEPWQPLRDGRPTAAAHHVADENNPHVQLFRKSMISCSVSTRSRAASRGVVGTSGISCAAYAMPIAVTAFMPRSRAIVMS